MRIIKYGVLCLALLLHAATGLANAVNQTDSLNELSHHSYWRQLLHINPRAWGLLSDASDIKDPNFFLGDPATTSAYEELKRLATAIQSGQHSVYCRFPARTQWISAQLSLQHPDQLLRPCTKYLAWKNKVNAYSASLVFAASYLNSPSSMYGHTFLRFDPKNVETGSKWLSFAVNFAAQTTAEDNSVFYAYKGIAGGYPGYFSLLPYYEKLNEYNKLENRDIWEYQLNFSASEIDRLIAHLWELDKMAFPYYFLDENCSYRIVELFDIARPGQRLSQQFKGAVIPIDTVKVAEQAGIITRVDYRPSRSTELDNLQEQHSVQEQQFAKQIAEGEHPIDDLANHHLSGAKQYGIADMAYRYLRYQVNKKTRDPVIAKRSHQLLQQISKLSKFQATNKAPASTPSQPTHGHPTKMLSLGLGHNNEDANHVDLQFRYSYHDLLDPLPGYLRGASLNMGDLSLRQYADQSIKLQKLDIIEITSISPRRQFYQPLSWRVIAGAEREFSHADARLVPQVTGGAGVTYPWLEQWSGTVMASARIEINPGRNHHIDIAPAIDVSALWQDNSNAIRLQGWFGEFSNGDEVARWQCQLQHSLNVRHALRFILKGEKIAGIKQQTMQLAYRRYF